MQGAEPHLLTVISLAGILMQTNFFYDSHYFTVMLDKLGYYRRKMFPQHASPNKSTRMDYCAHTFSLVLSITAINLSLNHTDSHVLFPPVSAGRGSNPLKMLFKQPFVILRVGGMASGNREERRIRGEERGRNLHTEKRLREK